jgi:hypothetical protein
MASSSPQVGTAPAPTPDPMGSAGVATMNQPMDPSGLYPQPGPYAPYFERSFGATESVPSGYFQPQQPFGPIMMFESNFNKGLGYDQGYQRFNARVPYHIVPNTTVLIGDVSASVTFDGQPIGNAGTIYRNYDSLRNRIFGWNAYADYDQGLTNQDWYRAGVGYESLGKYIDFRSNGYFIVGDNSALLSSQTVGNLIPSGNNLYRLRNDTRENAYSGVDAEVGGPLPLLGKYGMNMYAGAYFFTNSHGSDTVGFQARWQALVTQNITVNTYLTTDDTFGTNSWVGLQYQIPNYKTVRTLKPGTVRERLQDPVYRNNRIQTHIDTESQAVVQIDCSTGLAWNIMYVNPNAAAAGTGTYENPFSTLAAANAANSGAFNVLRVTPRDDASGTNLTVNGGLSLFDNQALISSNSDYELFRIGNTPFYIPGTGSTGPGPLLSNPTMVAGGSVVKLANNNTIVGMQFDASNAAGTIFGNGVSNPLPVTNVSLTNNTFANYTVGANLQDVSGRVIVDGNTFAGRPVTAAIRSSYGLKMSVAGGSTASLLLRNNLATNNEIAGLSVTANVGSTLNTDDPDGVPPVIPPGGACYVLVPTNTGIFNNTTIGNGNGIEVLGKAGSTINAVVENNTSTGNTQNGFAARADGGTFNLPSLRNNLFSNNTQNGAFINYVNGGLFRSLSEDLNANGVLDPGEDLNGNGTLEQGIVSNTMSNNVVAGLCIIGENASNGLFDIGGPTSLLGNRFVGNQNAGIAVDLKDTATAQLTTVNNLISSSTVQNTAPTLTFVLDFVQPGQNITDPFFGGVFTPFDVTGFGFAASDYTTVTDAVLATVRNHYYGIPTNGADPRSPIPTGKQLDINFVIGDLGTAPTIGATEYYTAVIGSNSSAPAGVLGVAGLGNVRSAAGTGPNGGLTNGGHAVSIFSDAINSIGGLTPADINLPPEPPGVHYDVAAGDGTPIIQDALTSGNLTFTRNALAGTISHEIGHALSLSHINVAGSVQPTGAPPIMGTGAIDLPVQARIGNREFSYSGQDAQQGNANVFQIQQLVGALGVRDAAASGVSGDGIRINAADNAVLKPSTFINNTITNNSGDGLSIAMNNNAVAQGVTIQGNTITGNSGRGIDLQANGAGAFIDADNTIGGAGVNLLGGTAYSQGNTITGNQSDGVRALASNGGVIHGNLINNRIETNGGNGVALQIDNGGEVDFGTVASNRKITGNNIVRNGGAGIQLVSNVSPTTQANMVATIQGNTISNNVGGGIVSNQNGPNRTPPAPPAVVNNNRLNLVVGGAATTETNVINGNGDVGIGVNVTGNAFANVNITNTTVTGTIDGPDPLLNGDGINLRRADSSLLTAVLNKVTSTGNAGDGINVDTQGNDRMDPNQPFSGTPNTVTITDSNFSNNGQNGAFFRTRGDSQLISDVKQSTFNSNGANGILVQTSQSSSFGDPTIGLPPGRRSIFDGNTINGNGIDGVQILASETSRALVEITSNAVPATPSAHAAASALGATSISNNGRDGVHIETTGGRSDILITAGTASTTINGNGTTAGGNGIRWDASGTSDGVVRVTRTTITNNIAGATEVGDPNGNADVDVADGDGIQANFSNDSTATLIVGNVGEGNFIQSNGDDGIAITATGSNASGNPRPVITITDNTIGGTRNGVYAGNRGDGVSLNVVGGTAVGIPPAAVDFTLPVLSFNGGVTESGAVPQFTMTNNLVSNNGHRGVNLLLNGASGTRDRENGAALFDPVRITLQGNTVVSNGDEGIFYRADSDMNQSRFVYLPNFPDPPVTGFDNQNFSPFRPQFFALNAGSVNGNTAYLAPYMNLRTVQNSYLTVTGNTIQNNGINTVTGEGIRIEVGTGSYVAADIQSNTFGGNLQEDLVTSSFLSAGNTFDSVDTNGDLTFDYVYLDDTAQMDMRFQNNSGNQIAPSDLGAVYTNFDALKATFLGPIGVVNRDVSFFQVDNGPGLNSPNNNFINFGTTQNIQAAFSTGGYNLRAAADPAFPNIGFAPFLP